jgi:hypothetical protein
MRSDSVRALFQARGTVVYSDAPMRTGRRSVGVDAQVRTSEDICAPDPLEPEAGRYAVQGHPGDDGRARQSRLLSLCCGQDRAPASAPGAARTALRIFRYGARSLRIHSDARTRRSEPSPAGDQPVNH